MPLSQRSHKSFILLKRDIQKEQEIFKLEIFWEVGILLATKVVQTTKTWENLTKDWKTL